jgi:hypothetical protein
MNVAARESQLEMMVSAALDGHDLAAFEVLEKPRHGYQAQCRRCGRTVWVGENGLIYSLLGEACPTPGTLME